jgi:diguanylate cyclase (GGDEF)-like protein
MIAIVAVAAFAFGALSVYLGVRQQSADRRVAVANAAFQAKVVADELSRTLNDAIDSVVQTTADPSLYGIFTSPRDCSLSGAGPDEHLDVMLPDGTVACSSVAARGAPPGATHATAPWLARSARAIDVFTSKPFGDTLRDGRLSIAVVARVVDPAGARVGSFVLVIAIDTLGNELADVFGGPQGYAFELADRGRIFSTSIRGTESHDVPDVGAIARGTDGIERLFGSAIEPATGWTVFAGVDTGTAFAAARSALRRSILLGLVGFGIVTILGFLLHRRVARPLRRVIDAVEQAARDVTPGPVSADGPAEVARLVERFNEMVRARSEYEALLLHQSFHDDLTGLPNRALFVERLRLALERAQRDPTSVAVLFFDLDRFKVVNEGLGHEAGDRILIDIADRLPGVLRPGDSLARFGGDEFVVLCEYLVSPEQASVAADRIQRSIRVPFVIDGAEVTLAASIGIAFGREGADADSLLRDADAAMTRAKENGRGRSELLDVTVGSTASEQLRMETELRRALDGDDVIVHYQPIVDLRTRSIPSVEALVRWAHPTRGLVPPLAFIPIAEQSDLIVALGRHVLETAARQEVAWREAGTPVQVSVNLSSRELVRPELPGVVAEVLASTGALASNLCIEITESALLDEALPDETLRRLKALGIKISVDDFGTGYSSLSYLQRFPVDQLKIDRSFVADLGRDPSRSAIVGAIIDLAHAMGHQVVAEGIEDAIQADELVRLGCGLGQGFLYHRPGTGDEIGKLLGRPGGPSRTARAGHVPRRRTRSAL